MSALRLMAAMGVAICLTASSAAAHLMPAGRGTLNVVGEKAYLVASLPVAAFGSSVASAKDGVLTTAELGAHEARLRAAVRAGLGVEVDGRAATLGTVLLNLPEGGHHAADRATELVVMIVAKLPAARGAITLRSTLWATAADTLEIEATVTEGRRIERREVAELTPRAAVHRFFAELRPPGAAPKAPAAHQPEGGGPPIR